MSEPQFRSALHHLPEAKGAQGLSIALREIDDKGMIDVRGLASDDRFMTAVKRVIGFELPVKPRSSAASGEITVLWLSIDQWLITCPRPQAPSLQAQLVEALEGVHSLVVDLSDARAILRLEGDNAREVLNKGTSADFTGSEIKAGTVRRLRYAEIAAMAHIVATDPDIIDLYVFRSFAQHAWTYLTTTARSAARIGLFARQEV
jgi:sarcosine oxidase subunit gamma